MTKLERPARERLIPVVGARGAMKRQPRIVAGSREVVIGRDDSISRARALVRDCSEQGSRSAAPVGATTTPCRGQRLR